MTVYGGYIQFFMRLAGQLTPAELSAVGLPSSTFEFLARNLISLLLVGTGACCILNRNLTNTVRSKQHIALFFITSLFHISTTVTYLFLAVRHVLFYRSYAGIRRYLRESEEFLHPPLADNNFKFLTALLSTAIITWQTTSSLQDLIMSKSKDVLYVLESAASMIIHTHSILYGLKLTMLSRHVKVHFLRANRLMLGCIKCLKHSKFCTMSKGEFERLTKFQWDCYDFLDKVNKMTGPDWFMLVFYMYAAILYRLYNASSYSALFDADEPQVDKALINLGQAALNVTISLMLMENGNSVTKEVKNTTEIIWNGGPKIKCMDCRKRFNTFANHVSHLPPYVTASRVFPMNMKTFSNMISSAATQLVILISLGNQ